MKRVLSFLLALGLILSMAGCSVAPATLPSTTPAATVTPTTQQPTIPQTTVPETTVPEASVPETTLPEATAPLLDPDGHYNTKEDVALYIHLYGCLPRNYVTKDY